MPAGPIPPESLRELIREALAAGGFSPVNARLVAAHLVDAEMKGVGSHGVNRLASYLDEVRRGVIDPAAVPVMRELRDGLFHVDGAGGIGIVALSRAVDVLIAAADRRGMAAAGIANCGHTGRMGAYGERAARAGLLSISFGGGGRRVWGNVVPHGGLDPLMSTNPYTLALPGGPDDPVVADFAISTLANGKVALARAKGESLPPGAAIDRHGRPTRNPDAYYDGGALLPAAGPKGSGLGIIAELAGDAMLGAAVEYNWLMVMIRADAFRPMADYRASAEGFVAELRNSRPADGVERVMLPGEPETRNAHRAETAGIMLADEVWTALTHAAASVGVTAEMYQERG